MVEPKYWGTVKGQILNAIVNELCDFEDAIRYQTHLPKDIVRQSINELLQTGELSYTDEETLWVEYDLYKSYENKWLDNIEGEMSSKIPLLINTKKLDYVEWIYQWKEKNHESLSLDPKHFFLEGELLTSFTNSLVKIAKESVIVINPFIEICSTSRILGLLKKHGINVLVITRNPESEFNESSKQKKQIAHDSLTKSGITLLYNDFIHAKVIIIDNFIVINSSMNLISSSIAGQSWETGMITFSDDVVESVKKSVVELLTSNLTTKAD